MRSSFEVLSGNEIEAIHSASMTVLAETGLKVEFSKAREIFREAGCPVDENKKQVLIPEKLVRWAVEQAPSSFCLFCNYTEFKM